MGEALDRAIELKVRESFGRQGLMRTIEASIEELGVGRCVLRAPFSNLVSQQHGLFHGGVIGALGDTAGGYAALTMLPADSDVLTVEYKINFLRPATGDTLVAIGTVLKSGRTLTITRADVAVRRENGPPLACAALQQTLIAVSNDSRGGSKF